MAMDRRTFATSLLVGAATIMVASTAPAQSVSVLKQASNIVLVHGLFADGSSLVGRSFHSSRHTGST